MSSMWIVNKDILEKKDVKVESVEFDDQKANDMERNQFRMLDDDKIVYYEGWFYGDASSEDGFRPLDEYGMPNAGCTSIQYWEKGKWETL